MHLAHCELDSVSIVTLIIVIAIIIVYSGQCDTAQLQPCLSTALPLKSALTSVCSITVLDGWSHCWSLLLQDDDMRIGHIGHQKRDGKLPEDSAAGHDLEAAHQNGATEAGKPVMHARTPSSKAHGPSVEAGMPVTHAQSYGTAV